MSIHEFQSFSSHLFHQLVFQRNFAEDLFDQSIGQDKIFGSIGGKLPHNKRTDAVIESVKLMQKSYRCK